MKEEGRAIHRMGSRNVFVKGGHLAGVATDILFNGSDFPEFRAERFETKNTRGTGCIFAPAIAACLARGLSVPGSVAAANALSAAVIW